MCYAVPPSPLPPGDAALGSPSPIWCTPATAPAQSPLMLEGCAAGRGEAVAECGRRTGGGSRQLGDRVQPNFCRALQMVPRCPLHTASSSSFGRGERAKVPHWKESMRKRSQWKPTPLSWHHLPAPQPKRCFGDATPLPRNQHASPI